MVVDECADEDGKDCWMAGIEVFFILFFLALFIFQLSQAVPHVLVFITLAGGIRTLSAVCR
jgi:hypothetical protein